MIPLKKIASYLHGHLIGNGEIEVSGISGIKDARAGEITFLAHARYKKFLASCKASAIIVGKEFPPGGLANVNLIVVERPELAYIKAAELFAQPRGMEAGVSRLAFVSGEARIADGVSVAPYAFVDENAVIQSGTVIYPFCCVGKNVTIDEGCTLYPHVTIYPDVKIGKNVVVHSGTVIGSDGFGYVWDGQEHRKIPHLGTVVIEDNVEIGANVTIDRGSLGTTRIGRGTKIDNLVQIAHNVSIGENSIIVSQVGISGSATIGKNVVLAGQAGIADHVTVGDNVMAGGRAGITGDVPSNAIISGTPHMPHREWLKLNSYLKRLPLLFEKMKKMEEKLHLEDGND
ncbi:MAG TPA: UDP-3-O-(3-hydroxymyristoyl)glucosamine N-acyltransferase [Syntrophorhabdaceae bacterium]|nr:UDP-3-O-(3-hydroxymyristoyl)glucosamine N-acyltransferase [Syntrophorhabdaceae bacterium]